MENAVLMGEVFGAGGLRGSCQLLSSKMPHTQTSAQGPLKGSRDDNELTRMTCTKTLESLWHCEKDHPGF